MPADVRACAPTGPPAGRRRRRPDGGGEVAPADQRESEHAGDERHPRRDHLLWEAAAHTSALGEAALAATPLTPAAAGLLKSIAAIPGTSVAEMARQTADELPGASARSSPPLEKLGYVERRLGERGHGAAVFLTAAGERARRDARRRLAALDRELAGALGERDHRQLVRLLQRALAALAALEAGRQGAR